MRTLNDIVKLDENGFSIHTTKYSPHIPAEESKVLMYHYVSDFEKMDCLIHSLSKSEFSREQESITEQFHSLVSMLKETVNIHYEMVDMIGRISEERDIFLNTLVKNYWDGTLKEGNNVADTNEN